MDGKTIIKKIINMENNIPNIYGKEAWENIEIDNDIFQLVKVTKWSCSGWRIIQPLRFHEKVFHKIKFMFSNYNIFLYECYYFIKNIIHRNFWKDFEEKCWKWLFGGN